MVFLFAVFSGLRADVALPAIFGSGLVLQRDRPIPVWGTAAPGEAVTVTLGSDEKRVEAGADGRWQAVLPARPAGGAALTLVVKAGNTLRFDNLVLGDVWLCSGQSNMALRVNQAKNPKEEIAAAGFPLIRLFDVAHTVADTPQADLKGRWQICSPETVGTFSAVGYFFGRQLHQTLQVPIGLINSSWGGTGAEAWTPLPALASRPEFKSILTRWDATVADFPRVKAEFEANRERLVSEWNAAVAEAQKAGRTPPPRPGLRDGPGSSAQPGGLYHAMIAPLTRFPLRGVIWYQGEHNVGRSQQYRTLFPTLITAWRTAWAQPDLPFLFVQLPNYLRNPAEPAGTSWAVQREAQLAALALPQTGVAVTIDVGEARNLHPLNKQDVGKRLALVAETQVYGRPAAGRLSPLFVRATAEGASLRLQFKTPDGLAVRGGGELTGFQIAGEDKVFQPAAARIDGDSVVIGRGGLSAPVFARYAWADNPEANLTSAAGLPAAPFRTDPEAAKPVRPPAAAP